MVISRAPSSERRAALLAMTVSPLRGHIFRLGAELITLHPADLLLADRARGYISLAFVCSLRPRIYPRHYLGTIGGPHKHACRIFRTKAGAKSFLGLDNRSCAPP